MGGRYFRNRSNVSDMPTAVRFREETAPGLQFDICGALATPVPASETHMRTAFFHLPPRLLSFLSSDIRRGRVEAAEFVRFFPGKNGRGESFVGGCWHRVLWNGISV